MTCTRTENNIFTPWTKVSWIIPLKKSWDWSMRRVSITAVWTENRNEDNETMALPNDPMILLSYVNTQLRDFYPSLASPWVLSRKPCAKHLPELIINMILPGINLYNKASGGSGACRCYAQTLGSSGFVISRHYAVMILPEMSRETHMDIPDPWFPKGRLWNPKRW